MFRNNKFIGICAILGIAIIIMLTVFLQIKNANTSPSPSVSDNSMTQKIDVVHGESTSDDTIALAEKYIGTFMDDFVVKHIYTDEEVNISEVDGYKVIEVFSGYCSACIHGIQGFEAFSDDNLENFSTFVVAKEKNSNELKLYEEQIGTSNGYFYIEGELPTVYGKMYNTAKPSYIVLDENNKIIEMTDGSFGTFSDNEIFGTLSLIRGEE